MSELTKIATILFKNLSDALLTTASELKRLDSAAPLSQAQQSVDSASSYEDRLIKLPAYKKGQAVLWKDGTSFGRSAMNIKNVLGGNQYEVYNVSTSPRDSKVIDHVDILGLYPRKHGLRN